MFTRQLLEVRRQYDTLPNNSTRYYSQLASNAGLVVLLQLERTYVRTTVHDSNS